MVIDKCVIVYVCMCVSVSECTPQSAPRAPLLSGFPMLVDRDGNRTIEVQFPALSLQVQPSLPRRLSLCTTSPKPSSACKRTGACISLSHTQRLISAAN